MAKDRTRHARRREPGRRQESPLDMAAQETAQALVYFADGTVRLLADVTDAMCGVVANCVETYRRLTDADGAR